VFQPELRKMLEELGREISGVRGRSQMRAEFLSQDDSPRTCLDEDTECRGARRASAEYRTEGFLENRSGFEFRDYARASFDDLLPGTPLHDGAVIIDRGISSLRRVISP
jgi:hypothetical protein